MDRFKIIKEVPPPIPTPDSIFSVIDNFSSNERAKGICFKFQDGREIFLDYKENEVKLDKSYVGTIVGINDYTLDGQILSSPFVKAPNSTLTVKRPSYSLERKDEPV